ncbi:hypothetical protein RchiOBHm_Chr5g0047951 [Rosa chinensis]|uniref:Uncharacterized protein n=1 Tax=Rosa chinensis TaxID=74649 RepID=A0A2P6QEH6_ROSCH|nr:hypothetical protein RchiOBHm_Chr5g0047951 [Rosa chinensis]
MNISLPLQRSLYANLSGYKTKHLIQILLWTSTSLSVLLSLNLSILKPDLFQNKPRPLLFFRSQSCRLSLSLS